MGKRKGRKETHQTLISDDENAEEGTEKAAGFFACYLLTSLCPRFKGHTYIGFTVNPRRRIRQHNGEIGSGAWRTKKKRPWEMVLCIYGFPTNVSALQFEWAWQHPSESLAVRKAATSFKSLSGLANKIKLAYTMLTLPPWQSLNLTVNLFSTKYQMHTSGCLVLPDQMRTRVGSMDELPCYSLIDDEWDVDNNVCELSCEENVTQETDHITDYDVDTVVQSSGSIGGEDQGPAFMFGDSPATKSIMAGGRDDEEWVLTESPDVATMSRQVEIIDVFTPSPGCAVNSGSKKRRRWTSVGPEIIDLTYSPLFVG